MVTLAKALSLQPPQAHLVHIRANQGGEALQLLSGAGVEARLEYGVPVREGLEEVIDNIQYV